MAMHIPEHVIKGCLVKAPGNWVRHGRSMRLTKAKFCEIMAATWSLRQFIITSYHRIGR